MGNSRQSKRYVCKEYLILPRQTSRKRSKRTHVSLHNGSCKCVRPSSPPALIPAEAACLLTLESHWRMDPMHARCCSCAMSRRQRTSCKAAYPPPCANLRRRVSCVLDSTMPSIDSARPNSSSSEPIIHETRTRTRMVRHGCMQLRKCVSQGLIATVNSVTQELTDRLSEGGREDEWKRAYAHWPSPHHLLRLA
jgi:hypothetical protein